MTFKDYFNLILRSAKSKIDEVTLFTALCNALNFSARNIVAKNIHKKRCLFYSTSGTNECELCDVLVIFKISNYYRFSFVQNKYSRNSSYNGLNNFLINCRQHYLLYTKPQIIINGVKSNILRNSQYATITTYSVFFIDSKGNFDFDLASSLL